MNYSTVSNKTNLTEMEELSDGEISEKYYLLRKQYDNLSSNYESTKQELHETKRNYQTALDVQSHLNAELESVQAGEEKRRAELSTRISMLQEQILTLREEHSDTAERHAKEVKELETEIRRLKEANATVDNRASPERDTGELDEIRLALSSAASEAASAKLALEEARNEIVSWRLKVEELVTEMGELRATSEVRREELKAAAEREAAALADLAEARAALQQLDAQASQPHAAKGNSIFAEVEDKRQEMAKNLIQMKQTNSRLRREVASKQAEVEALLQEKQALWEAQAGAAAHHDRELLEGYCERITQLEGVCERQRRELARWGRQQDAAHPPHPAWLPAVLQHLKYSPRTILILFHIHFITCR
ncbi:PREDICTED: protein Spindly [Papilio xuthus]|uniref:Protein Spindly n=1 Tax=Papilio xuthus TaxID=66420 RepID=A0AAJ6ZLE6_PAPXU|nr:PREDICTED: protein Spindly [Papilio xuthus]